MRRVDRRRWLLSLLLTGTLGIPGAGALPGTWIPPGPDGPQIPGVFAVTFTESGLPGGTSWGVVVDKLTYRSINTTVVVQEHSGLHPATFLPAGLYQPDPPVATVVVNDVPVFQNVTYTKANFTVPPSDSSTPAQTGLFGLPVPEGNLVLLTLLALVGAAVVLFLVLPRRPRRSAREEEDEEEAPHRAASSTRRRSNASRRKDDRERRSGDRRTKDDL